MVPFGRGGPGFSVLDVTNPVILEGAVGADGVTRAAGSGPLHMFQFLMTLILMRWSELIIMEELQEFLIQDFR